MPVLYITHIDCRQYRTDRPCAPHKSDGRTCNGCVAYDPLQKRILIVKLDATGDVLRTTSLLRPLHHDNPGAHVTWITRPEALDVLRPNRYIDDVVPLDESALLLLATQQFDIVVNPDASLTSCRIATMARATDKRGFVLGDRGGVRALNEHARLWYEMGLSDPLKRGNSRTYQAILLGMSGLSETDHPIIWEISDDEAAFAAHFAQQHRLREGGSVVIGLNTGAGGRWRWKKWTIEGYEGLIRSILTDFPDAVVMLYGGPEERERNSALTSLFPGRLIDTGTTNTLRRFGALVSLCDVMVTGDTMALHLAAALGKRIVALFGPTSAAEIELYGRGDKIVPSNMPCLGCYLSDCAVRPACMERIDPNQVRDALRHQMMALTRHGATHG